MAAQVTTTAASDPNAPGGLRSVLTLNGTILGIAEANGSAVDASGHVLGRVLASPDGTETLVATAAKSSNHRGAAAALLATVPVTTAVKTVPVDLASVPMAALEGLAMHAASLEPSVDPRAAMDDALPEASRNFSSAAVEGPVDHGAPYLKVPAALAAWQGAMHLESARTLSSEGRPVLGLAGECVGFVKDGTVLKAAQGVAATEAQELSGALIDNEGVVRDAEGAVFGVVVQPPVSWNAAVR